MVRILKDLDTDITGRHVLIVEDIIDTGLTLSWLVANLRSRGPASVEICTLLRKPEAVKMAVSVKYVGFDIPDEFVVGYGLDHAEKYRNLRCIGTLAPHVYAGPPTSLATRGDRRVRKRSCGATRRHLWGDSQGLAPGSGEHST